MDFGKSIRTANRQIVYGNRLLRCHAVRDSAGLEIDKPKSVD